MASVDFSTVTDAQSNSEIDHEDCGAAVVAVAQSIYGRSKETAALLDAYQKLLATRTSSREPSPTVIVHGESGCGKTILVDTLREPVIGTNGYFVAGKYFQRNGTVQEPYSAILAAFSDLCDLVIQSDDFNKEKQQELAIALGSDVQLLLKSISNLGPLVGNLKEEGEQIEASFAQFKVACKTFLHTISSEQHPIVMFLDDVQWADEGSIYLIQMFLKDSELRNVLLILAYRDEEAAQVFEEQAGVLSDTMPDHTIDIALSNLDKASVHEIVKSILVGSSEDHQEEISQLSGLVSKRTRGNPMHTMMFMETIQQEGLLVFDCDAKKWIFSSVDEIQQTLMVSETLADLLTRKIQRCPKKLKEALKVASLVGYCFAELLLVHVACSTIADSGAEIFNNHDKLSESDRLLQSSSVLSSLSEAVQEGFIEKISHGYQFAHDKIQAAFQSLISEDEEIRLHRLIGQAFLAYESEEKSNIYRAAVHLNCAAGFLRNNEERERIAQINLEAAQFCMEISSFDRAVVALRNGLDILGQGEQWSEEHLSLTFKMMETLARAQLIVGDFAACKKTTREALTHGRTAAENANLLSIDVEVRMAGNEVDDAIATANHALGFLGVKMPRKARLPHVFAKLVKVKFMLRNKTDEELLNLPLTDDILAITAVKILMHICTYCLMKDAPDMAIFPALLATEITLKQGLSQHSPCAFAIYGVAEVSVGRIDQAYRFGKLALAMLDRLDYSETECPTVGYVLTILSSKKERLDELVTPFILAADKGFEHGDVMYATFCASQCYSIHVYMGTHLASLEKEMRRSYDIACSLGQDALLGWLQPSHQYVLNMQADVVDWDNIAVLTGEIMNEEEYFHQAHETNHAIYAMVGLGWKAKIAIEFGQFALAVSVLEMSKPYDSEGVRISWTGAANYLEYALAYFGMFEITGQRRHLREGRRNKRWLKGKENSGCPTASPYLAFLVAWETTVGKKFVKESVLRAAYDRGLATLVETNTPTLEAMLSERAGFEFARRRMLIDAERYFDRALHIYQYEWGATAKYNQLKQKSEAALYELKNCTSDIEGIQGRCISVPVPC